MMICPGSFNDLKTTHNVLSLFLKAWFRERFLIGEDARLPNWVGKESEECGGISNRGDSWDFTMMPNIFVLMVMYCQTLKDVPLLRFLYNLGDETETHLLVLLGKPLRNVLGKDSTNST